MGTRAGVAGGRRAAVFGLVIAGISALSLSRRDGLVIEGLSATSALLGLAFATAGLAVAVGHRKLLYAVPVLLGSAGVLAAASTLIALATDGDRLVLLAAGAPACVLTGCAALGLSRALPRGVPDHLDDSIIGAEGHTPH